MNLVWLFEYLIKEHIGKQKMVNDRFTIFILPLPANIETINVVMQDAVIDKYVLTMALVCPSSTAVALLNDGYICKC